MNRTLLWLLIAAAAVLVQTVPSVTEEDNETACEAERSEFYARSLLVRRESLSHRKRLIGEVDDLMRRYGDTAPKCTSHLAENKAYLFSIDRDWRRAREVVERQLDASQENPDLIGTPESHVRLLLYRGYLLSELGETVEGARSYYDAAALSMSVEADIGSRALAEAASTARILGDNAASARYIQATLDLIRDSLATNSRLQDPLGLVLTSRAILTMETMASQPGDSLHKAEASTLLAHADRALDELSSVGQFLGFRATALSLRALALQILGENDVAAKAIAEAKRAAAKSEPMLPVAPYSVWMIESRICALQQNWECARGAASRALDNARARSDLEGEAEAIEQLGSIEEGEGDWSRALHHYRSAVSLQETYRDRLGLQDWSTSAFAKVQSSYHGLVRTHLAMGHVEEAFTVLDATRARYLQDLAHHHAVRKSLNESSRYLVDSLSSRLVDTRVELYRESRPDRQIELTTDVSELQTQLETLTGSRRRDTNLDVRELQARMSSQNRTVVAYMVDHQGSTAFVVNADTVAARPLSATPSSIEGHLERVGSPWRNQSLSEPTFSLDALHKLYVDLWAPINDLVSTPSVVIVPDAITSTAPFAALPRGPATEYESAPYLVNDLTIGYDVSASAVLGPGRPRHHGDTAVIMGKETFGGSMWNTVLPDLDHVASELEGVRASIGGESLIDERATETEFYRRAQQADVIHIASHAEADPRFPLSSRIELTADEQEDGTLHLYEILETTLQASMVVLSGCSTGSGAAVAGEGIIGLQYGMRAAGAKSTVATLWPASDEASAELMTDFYSGIADGSSKDEALRDAQLEYIRSNSGIRASPFFWAAPTLSGDTSAVYEPSASWRSFIGGAFVLALMGIAWGLYKIQLHVRLQRSVR